MRTSFYLAFLGQKIHCDKSGRECPDMDRLLHSKHRVSVGFWKRLSELIARINNR